MKKKRDSLSLHPREGLVAAHLFLDEVLDEAKASDPQYQDSWGHVITTWSMMTPFGKRDFKDRAYWEKWCELVGTELSIQGDAESEEFELVELSAEQAFRSLVALLRYNRQRYDFSDIELLLNDLNLDENEITQKLTRWEQWLECIRLAKRGPLTLPK